jgi:hypothetical protein
VQHRAIEFYGMQADMLNQTAAEKRLAGDAQAAREHEHAATTSQREAVELTRRAEASWAEASELGKAASRASALADAGKRKASRLVDAGKRAAEAQAAADLIAQHLSAASVAEKSAAEAIHKADEKAHVRSGKMWQL